MLCCFFGAVMKRPAGACRRFIDQHLNRRQELLAVVVDAETLCTVPRTCTSLGDRFTVVGPRVSGTSYT